MRNKKEIINKNEVIEWMDRMKEVQRIQYDYFKYLITLSTGSILIIIAILEKVFTDPRKLVMLLIMISIAGFMATIIFSLCALPNTGNMILYINGLQRAVWKNELTMKKDFEDKIDIALDNIKIFGWGVFWSYICGIGILFVSVGFYFFY